MQIQHWPSTKFTSYRRHLRRNDHAVDQMVASINEFGFKIPILALSNGEVIDGDLRLKAARRIGLELVPVILCDEWSEAQVKAFRLLVNRSATWAEFDFDVVALELADLKALDFDLSLTGFDKHEIDNLLFAGPDDDNEVAPKPSEEAITRGGDVWILGSHRVLCGDATNADDVARLLGDAKPHLMITDPPYGVEFVWLTAECTPGKASLGR